MPLSIYMDAHVPAAITAGLRRRGVDVLTSQDDGSDRWPDERLLERATALGRVLFSQDDDLLRVAAEWQQQRRPSKGIIYSHQLSAGIGTLIKDLELVLSCCTVDELADRVTYLPLK
jgi:predicted nuclease of predicted toxin-antitoxin system